MRSTLLNLNQNREVAESTNNIRHIHGIVHQQIGKNNLGYNQATNKHLKMVVFDEGDMVRV